MGHEGHKRDVVAVIPARMASIRLPGKPLADICGLPMIEHVRQRTIGCKRIDRVIVATPDEEIRRAVEAFGGEVIMTSNTHEDCIDRVAEVATQLDTEQPIIMVQGDEPLVNTFSLDILIGTFSDCGYHCAVLVEKLRSVQELFSRDVVKTVISIKNEVLYFSREPVPTTLYDEAKDFVRYKLLGIVIFSKDFLRAFAMSAKSPLEKIEKIGLLRLMEAGYKIKAVLTYGETVGVDNELELKRVREIMGEKV